MFHFLFIFGSFLRFRRRVLFTVAVFGSFLISFLVHFYCQPSSVGSKNEPKMKSKMRQKRPKSATVSTPIIYFHPLVCLFFLLLVAEPFLFTSTPTSFSLPLTFIVPHLLRVAVLGLVTKSFADAAFGLAEEPTIISLVVPRTALAT